MQLHAPNRILAISAAPLAVGILAGGGFFYRFQEASLRHSSETRLISIAEIKVAEVLRWREERLREAQAVAEGPHFLSATRRVILGGSVDSEPTLLEGLQSFQKIFGYSEILLTDPQGNLRFRLTGGREGVPADMLPFLQKALHSRLPLLTDIHEGHRDHRPHLDAITPLALDPRSDIFGLLVLRVDAERSLYPLIRTWPGPSRSAETLMVRREGTEALFLNELRHQAGTALKLRIPLSSTEVPAVRAVLGQEGVAPGIDYRGVRVLAVQRQIPGCAWSLVVKEDLEEAMQDWRRLSRLILSLILGLLGAATALAGLLWQRERRSHLEQQIRTESSLAQERERLAVTLRSIGDGVITTDTEGRVVLLNRIAENLTGWKQAEAAGRPLQEVFRIVNQYSGAPCENPVERVLRSGMVMELASHTMLMSRDGCSSYVIADSGAPIHDTHSITIGVVLVFRDVTEKEQMEESLRRTQKLDALGVLAGGIAHDFNNLLGGIFGFLDLGRDQIQEGQPEKAIKSLNKALDVFTRAKALTQQLLTFAKGGAPQRKPQRLQPILTEGTLFALAGSTITCEFDLAPDLSPCDLDENQMAQVVSNLVLNAKQAMPGGGLLRVSARNVELRAGERPALPAGEFVEICFQDSGVGMPPELLPRIFDPFFSTKQQGSGLGLATVHSIIHKHEGTIDAESAPGKGSLFRILLPASEHTLIQLAGDTSVQAHATGRILLMDDEEFVRSLAAETLGNFGYETALAREGREAIELYARARREGRPFSLVILDLTVPGGMGGLETAQQLMNIDPEAKLVVSSGYSNDPVMCDPGAYGFKARINKPYLRNELADTVARCLAPAEGLEDSRPL